jgi:hypothetical protein
VENALKNHRDRAMLMVMAALALFGIDNGFDDNKGHAHAENTQCVPKAAVKDKVAHIPNPLKVKRKH